MSRVKNAMVMAGAVTIMLKITPRNVGFIDRSPSLIKFITLLRSVIIISGKLVDNVNTGNKPKNLAMGTM
jgi:hypothetical protein